MFYATNDQNSDGRINRDAAIEKFATEAEARAYLLRGFDPREWDRETAVIAPGNFSDAWMKWTVAPRADSAGHEPFSFSQLDVRAPGQHPGGRFWWITPRPDVLTVVEIRERVEG